MFYPVNAFLSSDIDKLAAKCRPKPNNLVLKLQNIWKQN